MSPNVAILLCTYQGEQYLDEQLDSFHAQTHAPWKAWVSDDGSQDGTRRLLATYQEKWGVDKLEIHDGPRKGFAANFLSLICRPEIQAHYYALSDQDDIWHADKLARAVKWLTTIPPGVPALYCTRTELIDEHGTLIGTSRWFSRPPAFANALVQNIAGGNTMVFNDAARQLLMLAGPDVQVVAHDWWIYIVVSACGGSVRYDTQPSLRYRQHSDNLIGSNAGLRATLRRVKMLCEGRLKQWVDANLAALGPIVPKMTPTNRALYERFKSARQRSLLPRTIEILHTGVYHQTRLGDLGLLGSAIFNRI
ncbi:glycosyltransferase family 2 protein [Achromobacter ruhlandii]|uniref:glycosyltransferase family 2 protein n=1 Tax=Achromobacter ruhlandii TaxID=72557 RepID=UPI0007BF2661|nr:glycosyltransferase family 2 protein [Achromobacter ruhlandii]